uniref:SGNH hydrolase-type esterase domain-containing protein n=1 Tax=Eptatretus burgeri TaxID=7764 RepID=A0A8C4QI72_EPTBU
SGGLLSMSDVTANLKKKKISTFNHKFTDFKSLEKTFLYCRVSRDRLASRRCDVICRGLSGYNSRWARLILPRILPPTNKKEENENTAVTVLLGANDSVLSVFPQQHVPLAEFEDNLQNIVRYLASLGIQKKNIVVISPPPLWEPTWEVECKAGGLDLIQHFLQHVLRVKYQLTLWMQCEVSKPQQLSPIGNGWRWDEDTSSMQPVYYVKEAAPIEVRDLTHMYWMDAECKTSQKCHCLDCLALTSVHVSVWNVSTNVKPLLLQMRVTWTVIILMKSL